MKSILRHLNIFAFLLIVITALVASCSIETQRNSSFQIDLKSHSKGYIKITYYTPKLGYNNAIYSLTNSDDLYSFGDYLSEFYAFDANGDTLEVSINSNNDYKIHNSKELYKIQYIVKDVWASSKDFYLPASTNISDKSILLTLHNFIGRFDGFNNDSIIISIIDKNIELNSQYVSNNSNSESDSSHTLVFKDYLDLTRCSILYSDNPTKEINIEKTKIFITIGGETLLSEDTIIKSITPIINIAFRKYIENIDTLYVNIIFHTCAAEEGITFPNTINIVIPNIYDNNKNIELVQSVLAHELLHLIVPIQAHHNQLINNIFFRRKMTKHLWFDEGTTEFLSLLLLMDAEVIDSSGYKKRLGEYLYNYQYYEDLLDTLPITFYSENAGNPKYDDYDHSIFFNVGALYSFCINSILNKSGTNIRAIHDSIYHKFRNNPYSDKEFMNYYKSLVPSEVKDFIDYYILKNSKPDFKKYFQLSGLGYSEDYSETKIPYYFYCNIYDGYYYKNDSLHIKIDKRDILIKTINGNSVNNQLLNKYFWQPDNSSPITINVGEKDEIKLKKKLHYRYEKRYSIN